MRLHSKLLTGIAAAALSLTAATAGPINSPVPANAYIVFGNLDWAWAYPCPGISACGGGFAGVDLTYQSTQGWRFPTLDELALRPSAQDFLFAGANVPAGGTDPISGANFVGANTSDGACATPYFGIDLLHCDFGDGNANFWAESPEEFTAYEQLLVRSHRAVPEPSALAMIAVALLSLVGIGLMPRRGAA